jgi:Spy/CpxP family protein refolding chaperone
MVLLTVSAFILGGVVTYYFVPSGFSSPARPPWSPRFEMRQDGDRERNQENEAADKEKGIERRTRLVNMWKEKLDLSQEQAEQFHLIFEAGHQKFTDASEDSREKFSQIRIETDAEIQKVLNPEQTAKYKKIIEEHRIRRERKAENQNKPENDREKD